ncbi:branched-chain amino acid transport system ATP-binding protein [Thermocatellispora tengchongensis]|uniref:Branched-chain amino acid transport system ATP-binding protein n=1 Tax=Thermocatellispora tengchongensis TaxID=1073253 RepID=A0A840NWE0_9ACTN|nr:ABC transporter ATP-binding protein [Thermocatellispora tengchongensis]MBB5131838.1 branched-chain amino acid transport system ATP-binding protein [Thermocatellispora tengchongensis]
MTGTYQPAGTGVSPLEVREVTVRFAGLTALDAVSLTVEPGTVHAIIGPNGAGKSTCFNVLSGVYTASSGSVRFGGVELTTLPAHKIAALGIARTFQNIALSARLSVRDNLLLGRHRLTRAGFVAAGLRLPSARREAARHLARVEEIAAFVGLAGRLATPVGLLPYGVQKRVELARALCMEPRLLLLDEPVAGMNGGERAEMAGLIVAIKESLGISVLLVEHDMGMVMRLADTVTVLDFGRRIAGGPPEEVQRDPAVIRAYLGAATEEAATEDRAAEHKATEHEAAEDRATEDRAAAMAAGETGQAGQAGQTGQARQAREAGEQDAAAAAGGQA